MLVFVTGSQMGQFAQDAPQSTTIDVISATASGEGASGSIDLDLLNNLAPGTGNDVNSMALSGALSGGQGGSAGPGLGIPIDFVGVVAPPPPIPEPTTLALLGTALAGFGAMRRRKHKATRSPPLPPG